MRKINLISSIFAVSLVSLQAEIRHYDFSGLVQSLTTNFIPSSSSAALKSIQVGDKFFVSFDIDSSAPPENYPYYYVNAAQNITFSVPTRSLAYFSAAQDFRVLQDTNNPFDVRWDVNGVEPTVNMNFWARDFSDTALTSGAIPSPMNLSGFHTNGFSQITIYSSGGGDIFVGNLLPAPTLRLVHKGSTNTLSWENYDTYYQTMLQQTSIVGGTWTNATNAVTITGVVSNRVNLTFGTSTNALYRLLVQ